ncbi:MAG TPA: hypothetical protein VMG12_03970, partial [Polyangiaceae bacterium]|nr:hypothetical protein [Polyangiaceae bacterium]
MDSAIDRRWAQLFAWAFGMGVSAFGCNAVLDIESAALEPSFDGADAGAFEAPGALVDPAQGGAAAGAGPAAPVPSADVADDATGAPTPTSPSTPVARDQGTSPSTSTPATPLPAADAGVGSAPASEPSEPSDETVAPPPQDPPLDANGLAVALPNDLIDAPVSGEIVFSEEASWEVDGVFRPTFEVHTPTASYWIVKNLGTMVSMQDAYAGRLQWIDFSSGFRPLRNIPAFATPPASVSTVLDRDSQTPTHLRLSSESPDG